MVFYVVAALLYVTAFLADAVSVPVQWYPWHGHLGASAVSEHTLHTHSQMLCAERGLSILPHF